MRGRLEALKATADALEDSEALAVHGRALYLHEGIEPAQLVAAFGAARTADPVAVAALIDEAATDEARWNQLDRLVLEGVRRTFERGEVAA
ncbi:MAG: hypothetical protein NTZ56_09610 [Acidobacteria bacterium]|nr:hypothetical protein [Acidobacteriota bacterium]